MKSFIVYFVIALFVIIGITACNNPFDRNAELEKELEIVNLTSEKIYYFVIEQEAAHLIDLNPKIFTTPNHRSQIEPYNSVKLLLNKDSGFEKP